MVTDGEIVESVFHKKPGVEIFRVTYKMTQGQFRLKVSSECTIRNEEAYLITYVAEVDNYEKYLQTVQKIVGSFNINLPKY